MAGNKSCYYKNASQKLCQISCVKFLARKKRLNEVDSNNLDLDEGINEVGKEANNLDERDLRRAPYSPTGTYPPFPDDDDDYNYYTTGSPPPRRSTFRYDEDDWSFTTEQPRRSSSVLYDGYDWSFTTESPSRRPNTFEEHFNDFNEKVVPWVKTKWAKTKDYVKSKYKAASDLFG